MGSAPNVPQSKQLAWHKRKDPNQPSNPSRLHACTLTTPSVVEVFFFSMRLLNKSKNGVECQEPLDRDQSAELSQYIVLRTTSYFSATRAESRNHKTQTASSGGRAKVHQDRDKSSTHHTASQDITHLSLLPKSLSLLGKLLSAVLRHRGHVQPDNAGTGVTWCCG